MKNYLRKIVLFLLKSMAKRRLRKFRGKIIAITGSIGKTSTKEAIFSVLNSKYTVTKSQKSMNSEFGLLLTILEIDSGFSSAYKWSFLLMRAFYHSFLKDHSDVLLLEMGVDEPGDMDYLLSLVRPDIAIMTNIFPVHMADDQFQDLASIFDEKRKLVDRLRKNGIAILNADNEFIAHLAKERGNKDTITYGKSADVDFRATGIKLSTNGVQFLCSFDGKRYELGSKVLGDYNVYVLLPAIICGLQMNMTMHEITAGIERYELPPGRLSLLAGVNGSTILDGSYNSSPEPLKEALRALSEIGGIRRKIAILGNMNELGENSKQLHEIVGDIIPKYTSILITVGSEAKAFAERALARGMKETNVHSFGNTKNAIEFIKDKIKKDDVILVKGSQNRIRLERLVKEIMEFPEDAKKSLARQEKVWKDIV